MTRSFTATVCLGLALLALPASVSAQTSLNKRVTIDVTEVAPRQVMELLARAVGCTIEDGSGSLQSIKTLLGMKEPCRFFVDPAVTQPLTMRLVDVPVYSVLPMICQSIGCEYRFDGTTMPRGWRTTERCRRRCRRTCVSSTSRWRTCSRPFQRHRGWTSSHGRTKATGW
jgi:hypothetical protein